MKGYWALLFFFPLAIAHAERSVLGWLSSTRKRGKVMDPAATWDGAACSAREKRYTAIVISITTHLTGSNAAAVAKHDG